MKDVDTQQGAVAGGNADIAVDDDVGRRVGEGYRGLGDAVQAAQCIP
jgi:hypothetical protein